MVSTWCSGALWKAWMLSRSSSHMVPEMAKLERSVGYCHQKACLLQMAGCSATSDFELAQLLQEEFEQEATSLDFVHQQQYAEDLLVAKQLEATLNVPPPSADGDVLLLEEENQDFLLAKQLDEELNKEPPPPSISEPGCGPESELLDPTPDMRDMFHQYNQLYFWSKLDMCEVKWSPRMTSCAGMCYYSPNEHFCSIRLSEPLLKFRPRKDFIETLLHEMIHAYLFVTQDNRDHGSHGPSFHQHMYRINRAANVNITVYHNFHDEVAHYKQHKWRCDGPCRQWAPYHGMVCRAMNRAPSPQDSWHAQHQATCGGTFHKVHEPEGYGQKKRKAKADGADVKGQRSSENPVSTSKTKADSVFERAGFTISSPSVTRVSDETGSGRSSHGRPTISNVRSVNNIGRHKDIREIFSSDSE